MSHYPCDDRGIPEGAPRPQRAMVRAMLARLKAGKDVRQAKIERLKSAILADDYENPLKLDVAADRMAEEIRPDAGVS